MSSRITRMCAVALLSVTAACSTVQTPSPADPLEGFNRSVDSFNYALDSAIIRPIAKGYEAVLPEQIRGCVGNFFSNIGDIFIAVNNALQGKPMDALSDVCRFGVNTTVGMVGLFDVASDLGLPKHNEDFGQTFGRWGAGPGPYLVLPFFGPSSVRDGIGLVFDVATNPLGNVHDIPVRNSLMVTRTVDKRAELLPATDTVDQIALDRYSFVRDAFLARRLNQVYDGSPPEAPRQPQVNSGSSSFYVMGDPAGKATPWERLNPTLINAPSLVPAPMVGGRTAQVLGMTQAGKPQSAVDKAGVVANPVVAPAARATSVTKKDLTALLDR